MDNTNTDKLEEKPISDDQELAKALAGVSDTPSTNISDFSSEKSKEESNDDKKTEDTDRPDSQDIEVKPLASPSSIPTSTVDSNNLDEIKRDALKDLRPLVDKLNLAPDEKFNIFLLLLRSTDDKTLVAQAYEAARNISDESARAQALLDVVKEIDYFSNPQAN